VFDRYNITSNRDKREALGRLNDYRKHSKSHTVAQLAQNQHTPAAGDC